MWRMMNRKAILGVNLSINATVHRGIGWVMAAITLLMIIFGGIRAINRKVRALCIATHWTVGMMVHFAGCTLVLIALNQVGIT